VLPVELLNGLTYALAYAAATSYSAEISPAGAEGTLQGIVATALMGIGKQFIIHFNQKTVSSYLDYLVLRKNIYLYFPFRSTHWKFSWWIYV